MLSVNASTTMMKSLGFGRDNGIASRNIVTTGAIYDRLHPTAWDIQSDTAVPNARRRIRVLATLVLIGSDAALVGIRQNAVYANVQCP